MLKLNKDRKVCGCMNKINVQNMDGTMEEVELINSFKINSINKNINMNNRLILSEWWNQIYYIKNV